MPTRKKATKKTTTKSKKSGKASAAKSGPVPPYGEAIRAAMARGDAREMKNAAASARKYLAEVESALEQLENAIKNSGS
jgi:hypothetical protein